MRERKAKINKWGFVLAIAIVLCGAGVVRAQTPAFTYQGRLTDAGAAANGQYDLEFKLFSSAGAQVGATLTLEDVQVVGGNFTVQLDFGASPFTSAQPTPT